MFTPALFLLAQSASASLSVGATVVRPAPPPAVAIERGRAVVRNQGSAVVTTAPGPAGTTIVTLTY